MRTLALVCLLTATPAAPVVPAIPTLGGVGKWLFGLLVALAGWLGLRPRE